MTETIAALMHRGVQTVSMDDSIAAVESFLFPSLLGLQKTRPPDPAGLAELEAAAVEAAQEAEPYPAEGSALPDGAKELTNKLYQCDPNRGSVDSLPL